MKIAYIGDFPYPGSSAPTQRVHGVAQALRIAGHEVTIVPTSVPGSLEDSGFTVDVTLAERWRTGSASRARTLLLGGSDMMEWLAQSGDAFELAIFYGTKSAAIAKYLRLSRKSATPPVALDVVEWYEYSSRPGGRFGPFALEHAVAMNYLAPRISHVMCISRFLSDHFRNRGCRTLVVPPLMDSSPLLAETPSALDPGYVHIAYAGSPGRKDGPGITTLFQAIKRLPRGMREHLRVHMVGLQSAEGRTMIERQALQQLGADAVTWHGRLDLADARQVVGACDYTYLLRPHKRYAEAGFPTKIVESLTLGTPPIVNLTSDLAEYLRDGVNSVVIQDVEGGDPAEAVERALGRVLSPDFRLAKNRHEIASDSQRMFSPARYVESLDCFVRSATGLST